MSKPALIIESDETESTVAPRVPNIDTYTKWYQRFSIKSAYGQLIALVFIPICLMAFVGSYLVMDESRKAAVSTQHNGATAILTRYAQVGQSLTVLLDKPAYLDRARTILQSILSEYSVKRAALIDADGRPRVSVGFGSATSWPKFDVNKESFGPLESSVGNTYGVRVGFASDGPIWLAISLDNQPLYIANYRVWMALTTTGLLTLLLLLLCLNFYSRRWITPIYEMRLQLQDLSADNLSRPLDVNTSGELQLLHLDIGYLLKRLYRSIEELRYHNEQTEHDLRKTMDELEIQNINYRKSRDEAIQSNEAKSMFLANISHELRTPLNSIDGLINLMSRRGGLTNEQRVYVDTIRKSSAHLLALINDVLDFSKIDAGKLVLERIPFNLEDCVFDVMDMLSPVASDKHLQMAVYYYEDVPRIVTGDALRFKQILTNLVSNALKFTLQGEVIVRVELEKTERGNHQIKVSVQDTGIGLVEKEREKLFKSFSQVDPSVTRQYGGTGLGLVISRQISQMMGGDVGYEDNFTRDSEGKGSTFWFSVELGEHPETTFDWPNMAGQRTLSHLQHTGSANVLRGYMQQMGMDLQEAQNYPDLLARLQDSRSNNQTVDWIIIDYDDNLEVILRDLRSRFHGKMAVFSYQMQIDMDLLARYNVKPLYQPLSRFHLSTTLAEQKAEVKEAKNFGKQALDVLVVDDHVPNLIVVEALLADIGVGVTKATSGMEAIELVELRRQEGRQPYSLIFMDIQMPKMSGLEATTHIRKLENKWGDQRTPIVALSAHALADEKERLKAVGVDDYISKPVQIDQLTHLVQTWSQHKTTISHALPSFNSQNQASQNQASQNQASQNQASQNQGSQDTSAQDTSSAFDSGTSQALLTNSNNMLLANTDSSQTDLFELQTDTAQTNIELNDTAQLGEKEQQAVNFEHHNVDNITHDNVLENLFAQDIDWEDSLTRAAKKPDLAKEILTLLLDALNDDLLELNEALTQQDTERLFQRVHRIHGASRYTGVPKLRNACVTLESHLLTLRKNNASVEQTFVEIKDLYANLLSAIAALQQIPKSSIDAL